MPQLLVVAGTAIVFSCFFLGVLVPRRRGGWVMLSWTLLADLCMVAGYGLERRPGWCVAWLVLTTFTLYDIYRKLRKP